jgi:hypothetical protein
VALLAPHNAPAVAAIASASVQAINAARAQNARDSSGEPYAVVPRSDGSLPHWPLGFDRGALRGPIAAVDALLNESQTARPPAPRLPRAAHRHGARVRGAA